MINKSFQRSRRLLVIAIAAIGLSGVVNPAFCQTNLDTSRKLTASGQAGDSRNSSGTFADTVGNTRYESSNRGSNWGWLGLVGLIGLAGLKREKNARDEQYRAQPRQT
jgi:hypothetical protein